MPASHHVWPADAMMASGGYDVQPELAAPPGSAKLATISSPAADVDDVAEHAEPRERQARGRQSSAARGSRRTPPVASGTTARKIITEPCIETSW